MESRLLIAEAENPAGVALSRALAAAGHEVIAAISGAHAPVQASRAVTAVIKVPAAGGQPDAFVAAVARAAERLSAHAVLPGTEAALLALAERPGALPLGTLSGAPAAEIALRATDKLELNALAVRAGLGIPTTIVVDPADPSTSLGGVRYPAVLKPLRSEVDLPGGRRARTLVAQVSDEAAAARALRALPGGRALLQPFLEGYVLTVNGAAWQGETLATVHQVAERLWPLDCGVLAAARTVNPDPGLDARCRRLVEDLSWSGLFNLQFLVHDGEPLLFDLNPRPYHSLALAVAAGNNLPALWVGRLLGDPRPAPAEASVGVHFRAEIEDALALITLAARGQVRTALRGARPRRGTVHALGVPGDRLPALTAAASLPATAIGLMRSRLSRR